MSLNKNNGHIFAFSMLFLVFTFMGDTTSEVPSLNSTTIQNIFQYDTYRETCRNAEKIVWSAIKNIILEHENAPAQLLRLLFHDCFIEAMFYYNGCDASVMLDDSNGMANQSTERQAIPNKTLKGFNYIDKIKELLESECPGVVSCADILVLATRDAIALSGGPYYPTLTGRRDSIQSYFSKALAEIPRPDSNISQTLHLFSQRGFNERETVALLGGHNIGRIGCEFIQPRLQMPDGAIPLDFLLEMRMNCQKRNGSISNIDASVKARHLTETSQSMQYYQGLSSATSSGGGFDSHYYQALQRGKGLLTADQELMADEKTVKAVLEYAEDAKKFRFEFASAMVKLSNLNVLVESVGEVRHRCSRINSS
ncbi:hypothetical protein Pfo_022979 [Paulownia fortunei]|nr:hypothetical protein Pfo_022979 [Paulownia fortunei]